MPYLLNTWYMAGFADEVNAEQPLLARTLLDEPVVFFRTADGTLQALHDRCPHRFAPLSAGRLQGDQLECPYHGLRFDAGGACAFNPHGDQSIPKAARVRAYPVVERHGVIWWWPGAPERADAALIPDYSFTLKAPEHGTVRGSMPSACDYQLLCDNIMDLTHADFLHAGTLGSGALTGVPPQVDDLDERTVRIRWLSSGQKAPAAFDVHLGGKGLPTDQWTEVTWTAPGLMDLIVGATLQGEPREHGFEGRTLHVATPETAGRCHYWYWSVRNKAISPQANEMIGKVIRHAFEQQDKPMLEAQQRRIGTAEFWSLKPVLLASDAGAVRTRRKLAALIEAEG